MTLVQIPRSRRPDSMINTNVRAGVNVCWCSLKSHTENHIQVLCLVGGQMGQSLGLGAAQSEQVELRRILWPS